MEPTSSRPNHPRLASLAPCLPPAGLAEAVMARVATLERRSRLLRSSLFGAATLASALVAAAAWQAVGAELARTGFYEYASLLASDGAGALAYWKELGLSLLESLPALALATLLSAGAAFLWALGRTAGELRHRRYAAKATPVAAPLVTR